MFQHKTVSCSVILSSECHKHWITTLFLAQRELSEFVSCAEFVSRVYRYLPEIPDFAYRVYRYSDVESAVVFRVYRYFSACVMFLLHL